MRRPLFSFLLGVFAMLGGCGEDGGGAGNDADSLDGDVAGGADGGSDNGGLACAGCIIDGTCFGEGTANPGNACEVCDSSLNSTDWSAPTGSAAPDLEPTPDVVVTTLADTVADDGELSLREAIAQANAGSLPAGTIIGFASSLSGTLNLSDSLEIKRSMSLVGHDQNGDGVPDITLDRGDLSQDLIFGGPTAGSLAFRVRWLGMTGARFGVRFVTLGNNVDISVAVEHCEFKALGDPVASGGAVNVSHSPFSSAASLSLVLRHSYVHDTLEGVNVDGSDGASATVVIESTVLEDAGIRTAPLKLSGIDAAAISNTIIAGAAVNASIDVFSTNLRLINTTVVGGSAPRLEHQSAVIALHNTVLSGASGLDCRVDNFSEPVNASHSFIGAADGCTIVGAKNTTGTSFARAEPLLTAIADNGGPFPTIVPAASSPLVDSGDNQLAIAAQEAPLLDDVRGFGFPRQCSGSGGPLIVDIGAAELSSN